MSGHQYPYSFTMKIGLVAYMYLLSRLLETNKQRWAQVHDQAVCRDIGRRKDSNPVNVTIRGTWADFSWLPNFLANVAEDVKADLTRDTKDAMTLVKQIEKGVESAYADKQKQQEAHEAQAEHRRENDLHQLRQLAERYPEEAAMLSQGPS